MELAQEVVTRSTNLRTIASRMMNFQDDWVHLSDEYQHQVVILNSRLHNYQAVVRLHGRPADSIMMKILKKAEDTLQRAESRLDNLNSLTDSNQCCHHIRLWYAKLSMVLFPENVEKTLKKVNDDIDNLLKVLKEEAEISMQMQGSDKREATPKLIQNNDNLYVPVENTQSAIIAAIEDTQGPQIILLHGGVGSGKSTLARYVVHYYGPDRENGTRASSSQNKKIFEHVIWVSCANCSKDAAANKQFAILQEHSPNILGDCLPDDKSGPKFARALQNFLASKTVLLILDDVTDPTFLYEMWDSTSRAGQIKYLVTSQRSNVCNSLERHLVRVLMAEPTTDEAVKILACLVGLEVIPNNLQGIARKIIEEADRNPLALACLASHFAFSDDDDKTDQRAWQDAYSEWDKLLSNREEKIVLGSTPRSLWTAMKLCIDTLQTKDARKILFVMYGCNGEFVPEALLRILHARIKTPSSSFIKSTNELVMRKLLKPAIKSNPKDYGGGESRGWSLRSLVKHYIEQQMAKGEDIAEEIRFVIGELVGDEELAPKSRTQWRHAPETEQIESEDRKARVAMVLCALYFDPSLTGMYEIVVKAMTRANISYSSDNFNDLRLQVLEPIVQLLDKPTDEYWKESELCCVREVLLTYTCKQQLDDENVSHLLRLDSCPFAQLATLKAIGQICITEKSHLFRKNNLNFLQGILRLMDCNAGLQTSLQEAAFNTLRDVCWKAGEDAATVLIVDSPGVLDIFVRFLRVGLTVESNESQDLMVEQVARSLSGLSYEPPNASSNAKLKVITKKGILVSLVQYLFIHNKPGLQWVTILALASLAASRDTSTKLIIIRQDGVLTGLVKLLSADHKPNVQEVAAKALRNLADTRDTSLKVQITNEEGAVSGLVHCLDRSEHPGVQEQATSALANLAFLTDTSTKLLIARQVGALAGLVKLLCADDKPRVQQFAACTLRYLADTKDTSLTVQITNEEGALAGLVHCLARSEHPGVQEEATMALENLALLTDTSTKLIFARQDELLTGLVKLLSADDKPNVQEIGARALRNLAYTRDNSVKVQITNEEGAVAGLVHCLARSEHPGVQEHAAATLTDLTFLRETSTRLIIGRQDEALTSLVKLLSTDDKPRVQGFAECTLRNLADTNDISFRMHICNVEGAMAGLVHCLARSEHPPVQEHATGALSNLASSTDTSTKLLIARQDGALTGLVKLLCADDKPTVQQFAACTLRYLADTKDASLMVQITNEDGAVAGLVHCLGRSEHPRVEEQATVALGNLAASADSSTKLIIARHDGALAGLVKLLCADEKSYVQQQAARAVRNLSDKRDTSLEVHITDEEGVVASLVHCLGRREHPGVQEQATAALGNLADSADSSTKLIIARHDGALAGLVKLLCVDDKSNVQEHAARAVSNLAAADDNSLKFRIANEERALAGLVQCLAVSDRPNLQNSAAWAFHDLAWSVEVNSLLRGTEGLLKGLSFLLADGIPAATQYIGARALTLINPTQDKDASLTTGEAYQGRAEAFNYMQMYAEALLDFDKAADKKGADFLILIGRCFVKTKICNFEGALEDADKAVKVFASDVSFALQERGILKRITGDLEGALGDLNEGLKSRDDYEILKHRGYVKFLLKDEEGARADAELALRIKPPSVDRQDYVRDGCCLGVMPVEYLGYKLK